MCPSARALVMSCVSACGTWHPFKSTTATAHSSSDNQEQEALHLLLSDEEAEEASDPRTEQLLKSLLRHMDILTAGSLFLLPSILPFLASAITAYSITQQHTQPSPPSLSGGSEQDGGGENSFLNAIWILLLPCVGVLIPLVLFKIMSVLEQSAFQCPFKRWKKPQEASAHEAEASILSDVCEYGTPRGGRGGRGGNARTAAAAMAAGWRGVCRFPSRNSNHNNNNNNNNVHASMISSCPTILAIQSAWRSWRGYPHGYGPLSLDASTPTSPADSADSLPSASSSPCQRCCSQAQKWSQFTAPPTLPLTLVSPRSESQLQEIDLGTPPCCLEGQSLKASKSKEKEEDAPQYQQMQVNVELDQINVKVVRSVLPKPRSILLSSLLAWTLLMAISSPLGLNKVDVASGDLREAALSRPALKDLGLLDPIRLPREEPLSMDGVLLDDEDEDLVATEGGDLILPSPSAFMKNIRIGGFIMEEGQPEEQTSQALEEIRRIEQEQEEEAQFMETMVSILEMDAALEREDSDDWLLIDRVDSLNREQQQQLPIETFRTEVILLNKRDVPITSEEEGEEVDDEEVPDDLVEDAFDPDNLQAMTMDPEDEHIFRDFLLRLESEDESQEQQQVKIAEPFVQDTMTEEEENIVPCGLSNVGSIFRNPMSLLPPAIQRLVFGEDEADQDPPFFAQASVQRSNSGLHDHARGQVFTYISGWTDLMIFAIALSLGGILVGLAQSRVLCHQLWDQHLATQCTPFSPSGEGSRRDRAFWISLVASILLGGSALTLMILMTLTECWDMPSLYFVGIGLAGMILVHAWVPNLSTEVEIEIDAVTLYDEEKSTDDHLIERDLPSPYVQVFVGEAPPYDAEEEEPMSSRRNACSLDESRRWEVNQSCLEPSCFSP